ncbi:ATPase domain-containing protein [Rubellimicrobium aerolatum]|uniref:non-specific serine/threonine protein kinase n=1 Tax=Rubellimicrobium aerolatum TaxID=490979 RepID=A0ABW0SF59_9RHOB|nr:ATPase domain-containing protein [Rubellimicrobium aerolatum]MBP1807087.1 circadian clock protein KaiC [Rubellimicrobium aerolatum]
MQEQDDIPPLASTGVGGLDDVLGGGLTAERLYLVEGTPGTGKTTLGLGFLRAGAAGGEPCLYVTLSETEAELRAVAVTHGWTLDGIDLFEMVPEIGLGQEQEQTLLHPSEVELGETVRGVMAKVEETRPRRVVLDSLSELRLLAQSPLRYRRQILALKHFFSTRRCTVLVLDDRTSEPGDLQLHSIAHGVISLEQSVTGFGAERRRLQIVKMRGMKYRGGFHDFAILRGGLCVHPRLSASEPPKEFEAEPRSTGNSALDRLLGGGLVPGTATLLTGPAGVGKTTTVVQCMTEALRRGEPAAYFLFDERAPTLLGRSAALGMDLRPFLDGGRLDLRRIDPAELSPGEFSGLVRQAVEERGARVVVVDSLNAYLQSMPDEQYLVLQMHELLGYLAQHGVVSLLVLGQHGVMGDIRADVDLSYLADTVMQLRFFEAEGEVRQAISVIKTRTTDHERTIREFRIGAGGLIVGEPLRDFQGVLTGVPVYRGSERALLEPPADAAS